MKRIRLAVAASLAAIALTLSVTAPAVAHSDSAPASAISIDLTVLPAGPTISSQATVDGRLAITNSRSKKTTAIVTWTWVPDNKRLREVRVAISKVSLPPNATTLVTHDVSASKLLSKGEESSGRVVASVTSLAGSARASWDLTVVPSSTRSLPILTAAWIEPGAYLDGVYAQSRAVIEQDVIDDVNAMHAVGIDTIVISYSEYTANGWGAFYDASLPDILPMATSFDVVGAVLDTAEENGQHVYVGLGRGDDVYLAYLGLDDPVRVQAGIEHGSRMADDLWERYGDNESFYGWYVTHETADLRAASVLFDPLSSYLKSLTPGKPVLLAPSGTPVATESDISGSQLDVFAYQDAVGAGYIGPSASCLPSCPSPLGTFTGGYAYTYNPENRIADLDRLFSGYSDWHSGSNKAIWSDLESWEMAGPNYSGAYPAASERVIRQIEAEAPYVDVLSVYAWPGFFSPTGSTLEHGGAAARDLHEGYLAYYEDWLASR